jgi:putative oligomerization/nucleic acid binding protein
MIRVSKKILIGAWGTLAILFGMIPASQATSIWKQANNPANYVNLEDVKESQAEEMLLSHPYTFDAKKLTDMFLSLRYNKALMLREDIQDRQVFFDVDLLEKKFMPHIVEAFQKATPRQAVVISIVQKDPYFIIRNDRLNVVRAFVAADGLHLQFLKNDVKMLGDYQAHTTGTRLIEKSTSHGVTLEPQEGQKLTFNNPNEIILDLNYDFATLVDKKTEEEETKKAEEKERSKRSKQRSPESSPSVVPAPTAKQSPTPIAAPSASSGSGSASSSGPKTTAERLKELKNLKDQELITPQEYEAKKKEILKGL